MLTLRENMLLVYQHKIPEYLPLLGDIQRIRSVEPGFKNVLFHGKRAGKKETDWFGQDWVYEPMVNAFNPDASHYIVADIADWRDYVEIPDVDSIDWKAKFDEDAVEIDKNRLLEIKDATGLWERAFSMVPIDELLCGLLLEPEACEDLFRTVADHKIKLHNQYIKYYHPDVICMHDDYGHGNGLFMSPDTWRELIKPHLQRVIDNITSQGVLYEHHCCGYMAPLAQEIADMGASSWNMVHVVNDVCACKQKLGHKLAFVGGVCDGQLFDMDSTTEEQMRSHVREMSDKILPGVGTVMAVGCICHPERNQIFQDELLSYGQQYFKYRRPE